MSTQRKKKLLIVSDVSYLNSGYSSITRPLQSLLLATGKYEIAELGCCHDPLEPADVVRANALPWKVFSNIPADPTRRAAYDPKTRHQFGEFSFNEVCLEYQPDIVWDIRDPWALEFAERSPFRKFFYHCIMPTVDSIPQHPKWISTFASADAVFSYTDWGADVLRKQGGGHIPVMGSAPPGVDTEVFRPLDKKAARAALGVPENALVVGSVMRNNPRKLIPQLIQDFGTFLKEAPEAIARRAYLYLHTSYPDKGWDIPDLIKNSGCSQRILTTYVCRHCKQTIACCYSDARAYCFSCNNLASGMTHTRNGVSQEQLATIYNVFDVYVQYASNEGLAVPLLEAASCGIPVFGTDYSAMEDVVRKLGGHPIKVLFYNREVEYGCFRAVPDPADFIESLTRFFNQPEEIRNKKAARARAGVMEHYTWDQCVAKWMSVFDSLPLRPREATWGSPARLHQPIPPSPSFPTTESMVRWCLVNYLGRPDLAGSYTENQLIKELNWGARIVPGGTEPFDEQKMLKEFAGACENFNGWEKRRTGWK